MTAEATAAVDLGLRYLADRQLNDGSFGTSGYRRNVAVCALAGIGFLASGSTPGRGPYGDEIDRCIDYLLQNTNESGLIESPNATGRGAMYGHGFALLFLCESYGMADEPTLRGQLAKAVQLTIFAQNDEGGWRYTPQPVDADVSVTVCQVMALRAARNAGFAVPREAIDRSVQYVMASQNPDGGFRYMLSAGNPSSAFPRSAAGVTALYNAGVYEGPEIERGLDYLGTNRIDSDEAYFFYGHYYAVQAMWHAGNQRWAVWFPSIRDRLIELQRDDGSWFDRVCPEYGTSMACIILQVPNNYLPILQR